MTIRSQGTATGAATLAATLAATVLACLPAFASQAPVRGAYHFVLGGHAPMLYMPPHGADKGAIETDRLDLSGDDTEGRLTLQDEIWGPKMAVPLHYHNQHAELFYVISGEVKWTVGGESHVLHKGELVYIPPHTPHTVHVVGGKPEHNLFVSMPGGFEQQQYAMADFTPKQLQAPAARALMADIADFVPLSPDTVIPPIDSTPGPHRDVYHFALTGHIPVEHNPAGNVTSKIDLSGYQSEGRYTVQDETWPADFNVGLHYHRMHAEIFYVLGGAVDWTVGGVTHVTHKGDLVYIPPDTPHKVHVVGGKAAHILFFQLPGGYERTVELSHEYPAAERAQPAAKAALAALHDYNELPDPHPYVPPKG